jgi:tetratricopeptide (TPR) repeat protein
MNHIHPLKTSIIRAIIHWIHQLSTNKHTLIISLLAIATSIAPLHADDFEAGLEAYHQSNYSEAIADFQRSLETNESAATHHNLALSLYQAQKPAEAIWHLERAIQLEPTNQNYLYKLSALRQQLGLHKAPTTWWQSAANILSQRAWTWIAVSNFWILIAVLLLPRLGGFRRPITLKLSISFTLIALLLSSAALITRHKQQATGIIISSQPSTIHHAPASAAPEAGQARPGERAHILDRHNNFLKIKTEANITGWISNEALREL